MNRIPTAFLITLFGLASSALIAEPVPQVISYQGRLVDASGAPMGATAPVNRKMVFRLYDNATAGTAVWTEQQFVTVSGGGFSILLGNGTALGTSPRDPLDKVFSNSAPELYLELTVDNGDTVIDANDVPITPRQRIATSGIAFRAHSAESITPGADLRFLPADEAGSGNFGLGFYDSSRNFGTTAVNGPVLFGQGGGGLGASNGSTRSLALGWLANGNVGIGVTLPTERLHVGGTIKASGDLTVGGAVTAGGAVSATGAMTTPSFTATGAISGGAITGSSLSIISATDNTEVAAITADGALNITGGGTMTGPTGNLLNITSQGRIKIRELVITGSVTAAGGGSTADVLSAQKRLVLSGATGWGDSVASTPGVPAEGPNASTGMRLILDGNNASTDLIGFGLVTSTRMFSVTPPAGETLWYGGTTKVMSLDSDTGLLTTGNLTATGGNNASIAIEGTNFARLTLTQTAGNADTRNLVFTNRSDGRADLGWLRSDGTSVTPVMTFKRTITDQQITDQAGDVGYVGINASQPKAPLHVVQPDAYDDSDGVVQNLPAKPTTPPIPTDEEHRREYGVYTGGDGALVGAGGFNTNYDGRNQRYEYIAGIFEGDIISRRTWFGTGLDTSSDARAKRVIGLTDNAADLITLMKLQVTDYQWIDRTVDQHRAHKRLIAQQVNAVFPQATRISPYPQMIPSVYEVASELKYDAAKSTLTITTKKAHDFKAGDVVDLIGDKRDLKETKVKAVIDAHSFVIDLSGAVPKQLFVYGKQVSDFRTVDYDAISMLNLSATQALKKRNDQLSAENDQLKQDLAAHAERRQALETARENTDAKFAALEALIHRKASQQKPAAIPAVLRK
jgi:hypothetical protein